MIETLEVFAEASRWTSLRMDREDWRAFGRQWSIPTDERPDAITPEWMITEAARLERERRPVVLSVRTVRVQATETVRAYQRAYYHSVRKLDAAATAERNRKRREVYAAKKAVQR